MKAYQLPTWKRETFWYNYTSSITHLPLLASVFLQFFSWSSVIIFFHRIADLLRIIIYSTHLYLLPSHLALILCLYAIFAVKKKKRERTKHLYLLLFANTLERE